MMPKAPLLRETEHCFFFMEDDAHMTPTSGPAGYSLVCQSFLFAGPALELL